MPFELRVREMKSNPIDLRASGHCPQCSKEFYQNENYCSECGAKLLPRRSLESDHDLREAKQTVTPAESKPSIVAERKEVTILFADVVGSFELIKQLDPEEAQKVLSPLLEAMAQAVQSHYGLVLQFLGDGIMALFGAPDAREDHATAACLAALRIKELIASKPFRDFEKVIQIRVGLNSGEAVVGMFGSRVIREYGVIGEAVHMAARMEQIARPGSVFSTHETVQLTKDNISYEYVGPVTIKGMSEPIQVYEILSQPEPESLSQEFREKNLSRFVGRDIELGQLHKHLSDARQGKAVCVSVVGDPGIGKSRLIREFLKVSKSPDCLILKCKANSYVNITPYYGMITLLHGYLGLNAHDAATAIKGKLLSKVDDLSLDAATIAPPILYLLDALNPEHPFCGLDAGTRSRQTENAVRTLILAECRARPVILVFEDLHWMDGPTVSFIPSLLDRQDSLSLLTICSSRSAEVNSQTIPGEIIKIGALDRGSLTSLIDHVTHEKFGTSALIDALVRRSEGNPLFAEELARAAIEDKDLWSDQTTLKISDFDLEKKLPSTVRLILASRIDGLTDVSKRLLQTASVIGLEGSIRLLQAVFGGSPKQFSREIDGLVDRGFLYLKKRPDEGVDFKFKHILVQEVAYSGLLLDSRKSIHASIVDRTELLFVERLDMHSEELANHSIRSENWKKAIDYLKRSGEGATSRAAFRQAVEFFNRALDVAENLPTKPDRFALEVDLLFSLRNALQPLGDRQRIYSVLLSANELAETIRDQHRVAWVQSYLTDHFWIVGEYEKSIESGLRALTVADSLGDLRLSVVTNLPIGLSHHTKGDYRQAIGSFENAVDVVAESNPNERFGLFVLPGPFAQSFIAWSLSELGEFEAGRRIGKHALDIATAAQHPFSVGYAHLGLGVTALRQGKVDLAIDEFESALSDRAFSDSPVGFSFVALHLGYAYVLDGRSSEGLEMLRKTVELAEQNGFIARHALRLAYLSEAFLAVGETDKALQAAQTATTRAADLGERANEAFSLFVLGRVQNRLGQHQGGHESLCQSLKLSEGLGLLPLQANCLNELGKLSAARSQPNDAASYLSRCEELKSRTGLNLWVR